MRAGRPAKADYGVDGYPFVVGLLGGGIGLVGGCAVAWALGAPLAATALGAFAILALTPGLLGLRYVKIGKFRHRDRLLDRVAWRGDEHILDVGTGGGLMVIGAAHRAPAGTAWGIDIWDAGDLSGNGLSRALRNVEIEGVQNQVQIHTEDARALSFENDSFDVVFSVLCIHNLAGGDVQALALNEVARVLRPGGIVIVSDLANTQFYEDVFRRAGLEVSRSGFVFDTFPFQRVVEARLRKP